ncbi:MAG: sugar phosphate isomerase/epimerase family protein [Planctomycetaceae bacterium]
MKRRSFLATACSVPFCFSTASAREPVTRTGPARFRPSLAAYSLREYFSSMKGKPQKAKPDGKAIDLFGFIDYCASIGSDAAELTAYFLPADAEESYLLELKQHAFLNGVTISGTAIGNDFTVNDPSALQQQVEDTIRWIERAAILGAPHLRIFAGTAKQLGQSEEKLKAICDAVAKAAEVAAEHGVFLGIENHGGISSAQLLEVMKRVESDWVGINLDTGNFVSDDPYHDMEVCAPYAVNVQYKPFLRTAGGEKAPADIARIASILRSAQYRGFVALEYEEEKPYERIPELFTKMVAGLS